MPAAGRLRRVPPGRAGRLWLVRRLAVSRRAADLLDRKVRMLRVELRELLTFQARTAREWEEASATAEAWLTRAGLVGGQRGVRPSGVLPQAVVELEWTRTMGVRHPARARVQVPAEPTQAAPAGGASVVMARAAYADALRAAGRHAVATAAVQALQRELTATRRRLRAVEQRWLPQLEAALAGVELSLEEQERGDAVRLRRARATPELQR